MLDNLCFFLQIMFTSSTYKALHTLWCLSILVGQVSLAEYLLVLRVSFPIVADNVMYHGYCKNCLAPAMDED